MGRISKRLVLYLLFIVTTFFAACGKAQGGESILGDTNVSSAISDTIEIKKVEADDIVTSYVSEEKEAGTEHHDASEDYLSERLPLEERLLIVPSEEDIPDSIKKVFTENANFEVIFDQGFDIRLEEYEEEVKINVEYHEKLFDWIDIIRINTNLDRYDYGRPEYSEDWNFSLRWYAYKVIDLDGDGVNEIIYKVDTDEKINTAVDYYVIFHDIEGQAYAYAMNPFLLTEDGVASVPGGAMDCVFRFKAFDEERYYINCIAYSDYAWPEAVWVYDGKYVTWEEYAEFVDNAYYNKKRAVFKSIDGFIE